MAKIINRKPVEVKIGEITTGDIPLYNGDLRVWDIVNSSVFARRDIENVFDEDNIFKKDIFVSGSITVNTIDIFDKIVYKSNNNLLITSQSNPTKLTVGNEYNNYEYTQTTEFKNSQIIVSGSIEITNGMLILDPKDELPAPVKGGLIFTTTNELLIGVD